MALIKLLKASIKLFKKQVITFIIIRRYDLGIVDEKLRYVAVRPTASMSLLRQKIWYLLDLPDYCEEVIILKSADDLEIPLTQLRNGNDPQHPYIMEVWSPGTRKYSNLQYLCDVIIITGKLISLIIVATTVHSKMLTIGNGDVRTISNTETEIVLEDHRQHDRYGFNAISQSTLSNETMALNKHRVTDKPTMNNFLYSEFKKSDLSCRISSSSLFRLNGRKSRDNFINVLLKIQSDLTTLSNKLSTLETRMSTA